MRDDPGDAEDGGPGGSDDAQETLVTSRLMTSTMPLSFADVQQQLPAGV